jgi:hypothetical protein
MTDIIDVGGSAQGSSTGKWIEDLILLGGACLGGWILISYLGNQTSSGGGGSSGSSLLGGLQTAGTDAGIGAALANSVLPVPFTPNGGTPGGLGQWLGQQLNPTPTGYQGPSISATQIMSGTSSSQGTKAGAIPNLDYTGGILTPTYTSTNNGNSTAINWQYSGVLSSIPPLGSFSVPIVMDPSAKIVNANGTLSPFGSTKMVSTSEGLMPANLLDNNTTAAATPYSAPVTQGQSGYGVILSVLGGAATAPTATGPASTAKVQATLPTIAPPANLNLKTAPVVNSSPAKTVSVAAPVTNTAAAVKSGTASRGKVTM